MRRDLINKNTTFIELKGQLNRISLKNKGPYQKSLKYKSLFTSQFHRRKCNSRDFSRADALVIQRRSNLEREYTLTHSSQNIYTALFGAYLPTYIRFTGRQRREDLQKCEQPAERVRKNYSQREKDGDSVQVHCRRDENGSHRLAR